MEVGATAMGRRAHNHREDVATWPFLAQAVVRGEMEAVNAWQTLGDCCDRSVPDGVVEVRQLSHPEVLRPKSAPRVPIVSGADRNDEVEIVNELTWYGTDDEAGH